jgi:hypothetical protein
LQWDHHFGNKLRAIEEVEGSNVPVWEKLWKLDIPAKINFFGWRDLHGIIPCLGVLANRHIGELSGCPICNESCEDIRHIIFTCRRAK